MAKDFFFGGGRGGNQIWVYKKLFNPITVTLAWISFDALCYKLFIN